MKLQKEVYSTAEARFKLGIGRTNFYSLIKDGKIGHIRLGRKILIPASALQKFIEEQTIPANRQKGE